MKNDAREKKYPPETGANSFRRIFLVPCCFPALFIRRKKATKDIRLKVFSFYKSKNEILPICHPEERSEEGSKA